MNDVFSYFSDVVGLATVRCCACWIYTCVANERSVRTCTCVVYIPALLTNHRHVVCVGGSHQPSYYWFQCAFSTRIYFGHYKHTQNIFQPVIGKQSIVENEPALLIAFNIVRPLQQPSSDLFRPALSLGAALLGSDTGCHLRLSTAWCPCYGSIQRWCPEYTGLGRSPTQNKYGLTHND